jgi:hypothetical protein
MERKNQAIIETDFQSKHKQMLCFYKRESYNGVWEAETVVKNAFCCTTTNGSTVGHDRKCLHIYDTEFHGGKRNKNGSLLLVSSIS